MLLLLTSEFVSALTHSRFRRREVQSTPMENSKCSLRHWAKLYSQHLSNCPIIWWMLSCWCMVWLIWLVMASWRLLEVSRDHSPLLWVSLAGKLWQNRPQGKSHQKSGPRQTLYCQKQGCKQFYSYFRLRLSNNLRCCCGIRLGLGSKMSSHSQHISSQ